RTELGQPWRPVSLGLRSRPLPVVLRRCQLLHALRNSRQEHRNGIQMASENGSEDAALKARLLKSGGRYAFFQAWRLLRLMGQAQAGSPVDIRVRPNLTLDFPGTDLNSIEQLGPNRYRLTANFLGLYGVTSPLPNFITEDLLDEQ